MLSRIIAAALLLFIGACAEPEKAAPEAENPFLWEVTSPSGEVEGWLFGTIHALPDGATWRGRAITDVIAAADFLVVEVADLDDTAAIAAEFQRAGRSAGHPPLRERVVASDVSVVEELAARTPYSPEEFRQIETWAAALVLAQTVGREADSDNGVDKALLRDFRGRPVLELEGARKQFAIFDGLAEQDQRVLLRAVVEEAQEHGAADRPSALWLAGDLAALERETTDGILADREVRDALLVRRNRDWAEQLQSMFARRELPLVAVGAAHLAGEDGLVALLAARGYTLRRLP